MNKITLLLLLLTTTLSFSQISIGDGDAGGSTNSPPIAPYYGTSYSQSIYLASEINASGDVTSIEYALNAGSDFSSADDNVDVWIGHTAKTVFGSTSDWVDVTTLSHVLVDGTITVANDVLTITFSSPFTYNGTDNLVVAIDANEAGYGSSSDYVLSTNGSGDLTLDQRSDSTNSDPTSPAAGFLRQNRGNITFNGITQACPDTSALALDAVTNNTATISWTAGGTETAWEYVLQASGTGEPAAGGISTTTNPLTVSGLTASTAYEIYLRAACDGGDFSAWVSTTFTTLCDVVTAPYSQDFENGGAIPDCMIMSGDEDWIFSTTGGHVGNAGSTGNSSASGGYFAYVDDSGDHVLGTTLETPLVDVSAATTPMLYFYLLSNNEGATNVSFSVDVYDGAAWNVGVFTSNTNTSDWEEITIDLSSLTISGPIKARFIVDEDNGDDFYDDVAIDDVRIMDMPTCSAPTGLDLDAVTTTTTATISWTAGGTETAWEYVVEAYGSDEPSTGGTATTSNPLTLSGLTANTLYDVYVRADCGAGDFSSWAKISFPTECGITDEALSQDFDTVANNDANCWEVVNGGDPNPWVLITDTNGNTFWNLSYNTAAHDDYLYSPKFSVVDGVTDAFNFKGWNPNTTWPEVIDVLVVDASDNSLIATLATDLSLPEPDATTGEATTFTYDLSAYEGQDVRIAFYSSTTDRNAARLDDFTLDAFSTLGTATNTLEGFTLYPTIVKEELNFRSQNKVEAITVFNLLGQKVFFGAPNTNNSSINLSKLRPGVYVVKVSAEGKTGSYKIVKE